MWLAEGLRWAGQAVGYLIPVISAVRQQLLLEGQPLTGFYGGAHWGGQGGADQTCAALRTWQGCRVKKGAPVAHHESPCHRWQPQRHGCQASLSTSCVAEESRFYWLLSLLTSDAGSGSGFGEPRNQRTAESAAGRMGSKTVGCPVAPRQSYRSRVAATPAVTTAVAARTDASAGQSPRGGLQEGS